MARNLLLLFALFLSSSALVAQKYEPLSRVFEHEIHSDYLDEDRTNWVSLPLFYSDTVQYPVIYVLDAEWRFDLIRDMVFDMGANGIIQQSIVVGIPHIEVEKKRGMDLTFSQSRMEYDGEAVDSTWYNATNSGGGMNFYHHLTNELIPDIAREYSANDHKTLIGHSYGGYFGGYILAMDHPFDVIHIYDPSIWFSDGEVTTKFKSVDSHNPTKIYLTYQPVPEYYKNKIEEFIKALKEDTALDVTTKFYEDDSHNSLFLDSFYTGILKTNK